MKDWYPEIARKVALIKATVIADDLGDIAYFRRLREACVSVGLHTAVRLWRAFRRRDRRRVDRIARGGGLLPTVIHDG